MRKFGTWFRDFFLYSISPRRWGEELVDLEKLKVRLSWLFGTSLYLSSTTFLLYFVGLSAIHLSDQIRDANFLEKMFFFMSPRVWQNYFLFSGGLFNSLRRSANSGEFTFIFINLGIVIISLISLVFNLFTINISWQRNLRDLRLVCYFLCFPVFGSIFVWLAIGYIKLLRSTAILLDWFRNREKMNKLWDKASQIIEKVDADKDLFEAKKISFLELKKENKVIEIFNGADKYSIKKI